MTEINRQPSGLSDFLKVQAGGQNPDDLSRSVRPTIDIEPLYYPDRLRAEKITFSLNAAQKDFIAVPESEIWKVIGIGYDIQNLSLGGNANCSVWQERIPGQGLNGVPWIGFANNDQRAGFGLVITQGVELIHPRVLTGGQRIVFQYDSGDVVTIGGDFYVTYVLLDVGNA